jgi:hypothetical protein
MESPFPQELKPPISLVTFLLLGISEASDTAVALIVKGGAKVERPAGQRKTVTLLGFPAKMHGFHSCGCC